MCDAIREAITALKLTVIDEFPSDFEQVINKSGDFVSLPEELLECLTPNEAKAYWQGAKDACYVFSRLDGITIKERDFSYLWNSLEFNMEHNAPALSTTVTLYFRNHSDEQFREIGERANKEAAQLQDHGFSVLPGEWLIDDWRAAYRPSK